MYCIFARRVLPGLAVGGAVALAGSLGSAPPSPETTPPPAPTPTAPSSAPASPPARERAPQVKRGSAADQMEDARRIIRQNFFVVRRRLNRYALSLGPSFESDVARLGPRDHYLDAGAGECLAVLEYLRSPREHGHAAVTAVSYYVTPRTAATARCTSGLRLLDGRFIEEIPDHALIGRQGKFRLITDVFGPLAYAAEPSRVLNKYLANLAEGGALYVVIGDAANNVVRAPSGQETTFGEWLASSCPGVSVEPAGRGLVLRVVDEARATYPLLSQYAYEPESHAPHRRYFDAPA